MQPLLFCSIGTSIDFNVIPPSTIPKALAVIVAGEYPAYDSCTSCWFSVKLQPIAVRVVRVEAEHVRATHIAVACA